MNFLQEILTLSTIVLGSVSAAPFDPGAGFMFNCAFVVCTNGVYTFDSRGCRVCSLSTDSDGSMMGPGGDPFNQGGAQLGPQGFGLDAGVQTSSMTYDKPCILGIACDKLKCANGYYNGPGDCQFCICAKPPEVTTISPIPYSNPCPGAPNTCDLPCSDGYTTGSGGCTYCRCNVQSAMTSGPTMSPADQCLAKMTTCQIIHPHGFMINPACDTCVGKDDIYLASNVTLERQPKVKLPNPCLQGIDLCMIVCESGYKTGPRMCQYCACKE